MLAFFLTKIYLISVTILIELRESVEFTGLDGQNQKSPGFEKNESPVFLRVY